MKIGIVGCGMVGSTSAFALVMSGVGRDIVLVDVNQARAEAEANDIYHAVPFSHPLTVRAGDMKPSTVRASSSLPVVWRRSLARRVWHLLQRNAEVFRQIVPSVSASLPGRCFSSSPILSTL